MQYTSEKHAGSCIQNTQYMGNRLLVNQYLRNTSIGTTVIKVLEMPFRELKNLDDKNLKKIAS